MLVTIPPGVENNATMRMSGHGDAGYMRGPNGTLWVKVKVGSSNVFRREGPDVHVDVPVDFITAALGGKVDVPTLDGTVVLKVPAGTQPDSSQVMRGKGIQVTGRSAKGNQYVHFKVSIPQNLSSTAQQMLRDLDKEIYKNKRHDSDFSSTGSSSPGSTGNNEKKDEGFFDKLRHAFESDK